MAAGRIRLKKLMATAPTNRYSLKTPPTNRYDTLFLKRFWFCIYFILVCLLLMLKPSFIFFTFARNIFERLETRPGMVIPSHFSLFFQLSFFWKKGTYRSGTSFNLSFEPCRQKIGCAGNFSLHIGRFRKRKNSSSPSVQCNVPNNTFDAWTWTLILSRHF